MSSFRFFNRCSDGGICLASYTSRKSLTWVWAIYVTRKRTRFYFVPSNERHHQWHYCLPLPFGRTLIFSRQDYHLDPRHWGAS